MANISYIKTPDNTTYTIHDPKARPLTNNDFDTINVTELNAGDLIVTGVGRFTNGLYGNLIGNANTATSATKATQDGNGSVISTTYLKVAQKGVANGLAELDANGIVVSSQLPSFVDDVIEGYYYNNKFYKESTHTTQITGETGKIYVNLESGTDQNKTYRWSGSAFVVISETLALGETSSTAYRGDRGKTAYDHATDSSRLTTATASGLYKVASTAQGHIASLTAVTKADITGLGIPGANTDRYVNSAAFAHDSTNDNVKMTLTRAGSDTATVTANIPKVSSSSAGVAPKGAAVSSQSQTTKFLREDGTWAAPSYTTDTNTTYSLSASGESVVLSGSDNSSKSVSLSTLINGLSTDSSTPVDNDYYVSQYANGGTTTTSYHRRPMSALWAYIKGKADSTYLPTTTKYAGSSSVGGAATSLAGFTNTTTTATAVDSATQNGHVYVSGTSDIYGISDGGCFVQAYSTSWVGQIYQDYRTGQIALRGKNNGTWQSWRKVLDSSNYTTYTPPVTNNAGFHNSIYRGKSLGTSITTAQWNSISAGTFDDMYIGDYWTLSTTIGSTTSNIQYVIAGFDYWWNCGDSYPQSSNKHHIVLVPAGNLYSAQMNATNITTGGYIGSAMYTTNLANARTGISTLFGDHLYSVRRLFTNSVNTVGQATGWAWATSSVDLMSETMVYGHPVWTTSGFEVGVDRTILPLFALNPASASIRSCWWLRSVATPSLFAFVHDYGFAAYYDASYSLGVRPAFAIY